MNFPREKSFMLFGIDPVHRSWRGIGLFIWFYIGILVFAAVAAPPVYWLGQWLAANFPNDLNTYLATKPFDDYFDRLRWLPLLIALPWLLKICKLYSWEKLGLSWSRRGRNYLFVGFALGAFILGIIVVAQTAWGVVSLKGNLSISFLIGTIIKALVSALVIGLLEEIVFRGLILRLFYTAFHPLLAVFLSAAFFAYSHFKMPSTVWENTSQVVSWGSGFFVGLWTLLGIFHNFELLPFLNLFMLGIVTGFLFLKSRSLMPCIGIHAGIVTVLMSYKKLFLFQHFTSSVLGSHKVTDGLFSLGLLTLLAILICFWKGTNDAQGTA